MPYAPARSLSKMKVGIYKWFSRIGYSQNEWRSVQRIIACSKINQTVFYEMIETAKRKYQRIKEAEVANKKIETNSVFSLPDIDMFGEKYKPITILRHGNPSLIAPALSYTTLAVPDSTSNEDMDKL